MTEFRALVLHLACQCGEQMSVEHEPATLEQYLVCRNQRCDFRDLKWIPPQTAPLKVFAPYHSKGEV